jgi:hypothetical protein
MLYPELFKSLESARWNMSTDIPWDQFDRSRISDEQLRTIKMNAVTEWSALPATEMFLRDNRDDSDFCAFMSIWFYEEQKHALVLMDYLQRFAPDYAPSEEELHKVRFEFDPAPALETLMLHFCGEIRLTHWYKRAAQWHTEPVIRVIYETLSKDEARHAGIYLKYMRRAIERHGDDARLAFARIGVLMANTKTAKALHPTNLHVSKARYPEDSVQSQLPDPGWLEQWLDTQIHFDDIWEQKVINGILRNLSTLLDTPLQNAKDLSRYRKAMVARMGGGAGNAQQAAG